MEGTLCDTCKELCIPEPKIKLKVWKRGSGFMCHSYYGGEKHFCRYSCAMKWLGRERDAI